MKFITLNRCHGDNLLLGGVVKVLDQLGNVVVVTTGGGRTRV
jgi:hypothetical protein